LYRTGKYTTMQQYDVVTGTWTTIGGGASGTGGQGGIEYVLSDGVNFRFANQTGCAVGALITNKGSGYTSAPTVTATGGSLWKAIVGGAVSTSVTVSNGGVNYTYAPTVVFSNPPLGAGVQATGYCTLSGGAVSSITVTNQGAGYLTAPNITFVNDPRENPNIPITGSTVTFGTGAAAVCTLTGAQTITAILCLDHGNAQTAVPAITITGGGGSSGAATAIMCWTITAVAAPTGTNQGAGLAGTVAWVTAEDAFAALSAAQYTNPSTQANLVTIRKADIYAGVSSGNVSGTPVIYDGGIYTTTPNVLVIPNASVVTTAPTLTATMGGVTDTSYFMY
jgi:hypothetical protein